MVDLATGPSDTVLVILDLISDFEFEDGLRVLRSALPIARRIQRLKRRAAASGVPTIYVNDNLGPWRSDFAGLVRRCSRKGMRGAAIARMLAPTRDDYCILKPRHSGFFATPLDLVLHAIGARHLILTGVSSNQCVLFTANDAYAREFSLSIPRDCISAPTRKDTRLALEYFADVLAADLTSSRALALPEPRKASG
jgi:nicotinamidase-related amidase